MLIQPAMLGDVLFATSVAKALKQANPNLELDWVVDHRFAAVLEDCPSVDTLLHLYSKGGSPFTRLKKDLGLLHYLSHQRYDITLAFGRNTHVRQKLLLKAAQASVTIAPAMGIFPSFAPDMDSRRWVALVGVPRLLAMMEEAGLDVSGATMQLEPASEQQVEARRLLRAVGLGEAEDFILAPVATSVALKNWPPSHYAEAAKRLQQEQGMRTVLVGGSGDVAIATEIRALAADAVLDLVGKTPLRVLTALCAKAKVAFGPDTGPMWMAAAVGTPTVTIFGPTSGGRIGASAIHRDLEARLGCYTTCAYPHSKCGLPSPCMTAVSPERLVATVGEVLATAAILGSDAAL